MSLVCFLSNKISLLQAMDFNCTAFRELPLSECRNGARGANVCLQLQLFCIEAIGTRLEINQKIGRRLRLCSRTGLLFLLASETVLWYLSVHTLKIRKNLFALAIYFCSDTLLSLLLPSTNFNTPTSQPPWTLYPSLFIWSRSGAHLDRLCPYCHCCITVPWCL